MASSSADHDSRRRGAPTVRRLWCTPFGRRTIFRRSTKCRVDGTNPRRLARRYLGSTSAISASTIYFDQQEVRNNVGVYSDLYAFDRRSADVRQLTHGARLLDPDLSPDGRTLVCAQNVAGRRDLVLLDAQLATDRDDPLRSRKRSSMRPDGRPTAAPLPSSGTVSGRCRRSLSSTSQPDRCVSSLQADLHESSRRPGGPTARAIVAAAAEADGPFNLYEFALDGSGSRQLTQLTGGAIWPDVSADGRTIVFAGYTPDGYDLFTVPYPPADVRADRDSASISA